ncbi:hypothetical protein HMPREF1991_01719 [Hoylesella loescheii DSM 19665 = JCM 12249 = ATCC 15930]|uniref:Uncharacterized protein n=1 Tax=Hoylesella loescheii DSM 19665 = JCM 12249 = ATCC 15930 TaxID=1122985 RepID=A0A069QHF8_HOYLO|nr:hypothetical protein HMPREF1991_01719 [Hoylesella loescheii DSM 19665 = JCM 12249 = ATCC 15930]
MFCKIYRRVFNIVSRRLAHQYHIGWQIIDSREGYDWRKTAYYKQRRD